MNGAETPIQKALKVRHAQANNASAQFDFEPEGGECLATFWRQATPGTTYWRGHVPMKALPGRVNGIEPDSLAWEDEAAGIIKLNRQDGDTAIWQFLGDDARSRIVFQMQRQGLRCLMDVDDTYLRYAPTLYGKAAPWTKTHEEAIANGTGYSVEMHRKQTPLLDGVICATEHLANEYAQYNKNVYHCPNSIDPTDWNVERVESDTLRIGYYGSQSHVRDWPLVKKALKWAAKQPGVEVVMIGVNPPAFSGKVIPWADDLFSIRKYLGEIDVGIAPLTRNHWADGKSDLKAMEYAMAGVMPIVQDAPPYAPWRKHGWGWTANGPESWMEIIQHVVKNRDKVSDEALTAKKYVLEHRTIDKTIHRWREAIRGS